jgi:hypothetical protein
VVVLSISVKIMDIELSPFNIKALLTLEIVTDSLKKGIRLNNGRICM